MVAMEETPVFTSSKLNSSTRLIIHDDKYLEFPYICLRIYTNPPLIVVVDTGCGAHNGKGNTPHVELKDFVDSHVLFRPRRPTA